MERIARLLKEGVITAREAETVMNFCIDSAVKDIEDPDKRFDETLKMNRRKWRLLLQATKN